MMQKLVLVAFAAAILVACQSQAVPKADAAAVDYFLKLDGVDGESKSDKHKGWIELESYSFGASSAGSSAGTGSGGGAGKVKFNEFTIKKVTDKSSPILMIETATGKHYPKAEFVVMKSDGTQYYKITLKDVLISSYQTSGGTDLPMEEVSLNFAQIEFEYGATKTGWDIKTNKKLSGTTESTTEKPATKPTTETKTETPTKSSTTPTTPSTQPVTRAPADSDGDGITDDKDKCPTEAETKNSYQDDDGCADSTPATTVVPKTITPISPKIAVPLK
jgi:type VI secretion system secreted protein Hcp